MKKLIQMILTGTMIATMSLNAQQDAKNFVQRYKNQDGFTVLTIGKPAMNMFSLFVKSGMTSDEDKETLQMFRRTDAIQVLAFNRAYDKARSESFITEALNFCDANRYVELIEMVERDETVRIFGKTEGNAITGLIVLNRSNREGSAAMICLTGKFTAADLQSVNGAQGRKIAGL